MICATCFHFFKLSMKAGGIIAEKFFIKEYLKYGTERIKVQNVLVRFQIKQ